MTADKHFLAKLLACPRIDDMASVAARFNRAAKGQIDLRGLRLRFNHAGLDLRRFILEGCDLSGSVLRNCTAQGVSFAKCVLRDVKICAEKGIHSSFAAARFDNCIIQNAYFGPRTLDLTRASFVSSKLRDVEFAMGNLDQANFSQSRLENVQMRQALLSGAKFCSAFLQSVSFERTSLRSVDFTDAQFSDMEQWGEPDFDGAIIADALRYQYGIVNDALFKIDFLLAGPHLTESEQHTIRRFRTEIAPFAESAPQVMLMGKEYQHIVSPELFVKLLKLLKALPDPSKGKR